MPFVGGYRIVDFVLSNLVNSNVSSIHVLAQYKPQSLVTHIQTAWASWSRGAQPTIRIARPESSVRGAAYKGTADAVHQNCHLIEREQPDLVAIFAADHVYRLDVRQMADFHQKRDAEVSIAAVPVPIEKASAFGIIATGSAAEILDFQEKPEAPAPMSSDPKRAYASMGNYLFNPRFLLDVRDEADKRGETDFGRDILPRVLHSHRVFAYDFARNEIPGVQVHEERGYWRDIGTIDAYRAAQRDVLGPLPRFNLVNPKWPTRGEAYSPRSHTAPSVAMALAGTPKFPSGADANAMFAE